MNPAFRANFREHFLRTDPHFRDPAAILVDDVTSKNNNKRHEGSRKNTIARLVDLESHDNAQSQLSSVLTSYEKLADIYRTSTLLVKTFNIINLNFDSPFYYSRLWIYLIKILSVILVKEKKKNISQIIRVYIYTYIYIDKYIYIYIYT